MFHLLITTQLKKENKNETSLWAYAFLVNSFIFHETKLEKKRYECTYEN